LRDLGAHVGSTVTVSAGDRTLDMQVVGRGVFVDTGSSTLGEGAAVTLAGLRQLAPETTPDMVLLRVEPTPAGRALVDRLQETRPANVYVPSKPPDLTDLERVGGLPSVVAAIVTVMGVATLAHTLLTSVRRRRRDLAVLKVLGFVRSQVSATVAWQACVIAGVAIAVGLPLGIAGGRWSWHLFAGQLGVPPQPRTPLLAMVAIAAATVLLANLLAAGPGRVAARTQPSATLRAE
jgi:predicted lysophospholipase L1 biosynthesis ABC-type transport system permease subunit